MWSCDIRGNGWTDINEGSKKKEDVYVICKINTVRYHFNVKTNIQENLKNRRETDTILAGQLLIIIIIYSAKTEVDCKNMI